MDILQKELQPDEKPPDASPEYRKTLAQALLYKVRVLIYHKKLYEKHFIPNYTFNLSRRQFFLLWETLQKLPIVVEVKILNMEWQVVSNSTTRKKMNGLCINPFQKLKLLSKPLVSWILNWTTLLFLKQASYKIFNLLIKGEAEYVNDINPEFGELFGAFVVTSLGPATLKNVDASEALVILYLLIFTWNY